MHAVNSPSDPGASQGARRATGDAPGSASPALPVGADVEVVAQARRRQFLQRRQAPHPGGGRPLHQARRDRRADAPRGRVLVEPEHLAAPARGRRTGRAGAAKARPQGRPRSGRGAADRPAHARERNGSRTSSTRRCWSSRSKKKLPPCWATRSTTTARRPDGRRARTRAGRRQPALPAGRWACGAARPRATRLGCTALALVGPPRPRARRGRVRRWP